MALLRLMVHSWAIASAPLRIVPLGDSITEGMCGEFHSYRPFLWNALQRQRQHDNGAPQLRGGNQAVLEFVGSRYGEWNPSNGTRHKARAQIVVQEAKGRTKGQQ